MKKDSIQLEQQKLDQTVDQIKEIIEDLSIPNSRLYHDFGSNSRSRSDRRRIIELEDALRHPYFGRLDIMGKNGEIETIYIGENPVRKSETEDIIHHHHSPVASLFYEFTGGNGQLTVELSDKTKAAVTIYRRRQIDIRKLKVINVGDKISDQYQLDGGNLDDVQLDVQDEFLIQILSSHGEDYGLKKVIATIQKEQNEVIRLNKDNPIIVQGVAGSGKSTIALQRISFLLYQYAKTLKPENILILAPNKMFISYMEQSISQTKITGIQQNTFVSLAKEMIGSRNHVIEPHETLAKILNNELNIEEVEPVTKYKGSMRFKAAIDLYLKHKEEHFIPKKDVDIYLTQNETFTLERKKIVEIYNGFKHLPLNKRRIQTLDSVRKWVNTQRENHEKRIHAELESAYVRWVEILPEGKTRKELYESLTQSKEYRVEQLNRVCEEAFEKYVNQWLEFNSLDIYNDLLEPDLLRGLDTKLDRKVIDLIPEFDKKQFGYEDLAPILYIHTILNGIDKKFDYIVVDESQDLNSFQIFILLQMSTSITLLGDITQSIFYFTGIEQWEELNTEILKDQLVKSLNLIMGYRSTYEIINLANLVIKNSPVVAPEIIPVKRHGETPLLRKTVSGNDLFEKLSSSISSFEKKEYKKIAVITKTSEQAKNYYQALSRHAELTSLQLIENNNEKISERIVIIPSYLSKGIEFDAVIIPNVNRSNYEANKLDSRLLFVSITRAHHDVHMYFNGELSPLLKNYEVDKEQSDSDLDLLLT
jgi:DNA helicase-2/ATP-dependent DNA helicase PcrA